MLIVLVVIACAISYLVFSMYNKNSAPSEDMAEAFNNFGIVWGLL
jgi:hypothetical protein